MISLRQIIKEVVKEELPFENMDSAEKKLWRKFTKLIQRCGGDMETLFMGKGKIEFPNEEKEFVKIILHLTFFKIHIHSKTFFPAHYTIFQYLPVSLCKPIHYSAPFQI